MARGANDNILFDPPRIKKPPKEKEWSLKKVRRGETKSAIFRMLPGKKKPLSLQQADKRDGVVLRHFLGLDPEEQRDSGSSVSMSLGENDHKSFTEAGLFWSRDRDLYFIPFDDITSQPEINFLDQEGDLLGLYAGDEDLLYLWKEKEGLISINSLDRDGLGDRNIFEIAADQAFLEGKGEKSVVFLRDDADRKTSLLTIYPDGPGEVYLMDERSRRFVSWERDIGSINYIAPAGKDGSYFYIDEKGDLRFLDLTSKRLNRRIEHIAQPDRIDALAVSGDRAAVLTREKLLLYDKTGLMDEIPVIEGRIYGTDLSFVGDTIFVWQGAGQKYLQIETVTKNQEETDPSETDPEKKG